MIDLQGQQAINFEKQKPVVNQMEDYRDMVAQEQQMKPKLFTFPNWNESMTVFDFEDLQDDTLLVLCVKPQINEPGHEHDQHKVFIWRGSDFDEDEANQEVTNIQEFVDRVMESYWGCKNPSGQFNIAIQNEVFGNESEEFHEYF